ncbi:MAG TPA: alpha/beta hydrolase [Sedimentisphaerales bacterium]|nr:alpha/beta hydrolase [Sedimentisphaerales bacterium]
MRAFSILLLATLVLLVWSGCAPERQGQALSADNVAVSYQVQGEGEPALVFVHGWCCDRNYWRLQVPYFARRHKVVAIDLAGHGQSGIDRQTWTIEAFGRDVVAVIEQLGLDKVILIGHSMGGPVILEAARQAPKRVIGLVGADTFLDLEKQYTQQQIDGALVPFKKDFVRRTSELVRGMFLPDADVDLVEQIVNDMCSAPPEVGIGAMRGLMSFDPGEALKEVRLPIYCINSDMRPTNIAAGRRHVRSFEVRPMSGIGHFVMLEDAETFNRLLNETISELCR